MRNNYVKFDWWFIAFIFAIAIVILTSVYCLKRDLKTMTTRGAKVVLCDHANCTDKHYDFQYCPKHQMYHHRYRSCMETNINAVVAHEDAIIRAREKELGFVRKAERRVITVDEMTLKSMGIDPKDHPQFKHEQTKVNNP